MKSAIIISLFGILSVSFAAKDDLVLDELEKATQGKLDNLSRKLRRLTTFEDDKLDSMPRYVARVEKTPVDQFVEEVADILKEAATKLSKLSLPDLGLDRFPKLMDLLKKPLDTNMKKKRLIKEIVDTAENGISVLGDSMKKLIEVVKPIKGEAETIAIDIHKAIGKATDKLLDAMIAAG